jgi:phosphoribosylanthranilate isomerase
MRVKICGITDPRDAALAAELGASAIGMVFWPSSPRHVDLARAREIVAALPPDVNAIGVFVNQTREAAAIARELGLAAVQMHGDETPADYADFRSPIIRAVAVRGEETHAAAAAVPDWVTVLLDAHDPVNRGGTGRVIDWSVAAAIARRRPVYLSGGVTPENVGAAIATVRPFAIDVSSGVESAPGRKDPAKLRALFAAVAEEAHERR